MKPHAWVQRCTESENLSCCDPVATHVIVLAVTNLTLSLFTGAKAKIRPGFPSQGNKLTFLGMKDSILLFLNKLFLRSSVFLS